MVSTLVLAACGDDDDASGGDATSPATEAPAATEAPTDTTTPGESETTVDDTIETTTSETAAPAEPTGEPVKVMTMIPLDTQALNYPEVEKIVNGFETMVNETGGVQGRPLEVIVCNEKRDANVAAACARQAAEEGIVAVLGNASQQGAAYLPILEEANIAALGGFPYNPIDYNSPVSFPIGSASLVIFEALGQWMCESNPETVALGVIDLPNATPNADAMKRGLASCDPEINEVLIPFGAPDGAPFVAAMSGADGILLALDQANLQKIIENVRAAGMEVPIGTLGLSEPTIKLTGEAANGVYVFDSYPPVHSTSPYVPEFLDFIERFAPDTDPINSQGFMVFQAYEIFRAIAEDLPTLDGPSFLKALGSTSSLQVGDYDYSFDFTTPQGSAELPRIFNANVYVGQVQDGVTLLAQDEPLQPFGS